MTDIVAKNGQIVVKGGGVATNCNCCDPPCTCGVLSLPYRLQTGFYGFPGRWCCRGPLPGEIILRLEATPSASSFVSYQNVQLGNTISGFYFDEPRGYHARRYKRTLTLDVESINADYSMRTTSLWSPQSSGVSVCGYSFGPYGCPTIRPGRPPGETVNGITYLTPFDTESFPAYTISLSIGAVCGSCSGTILREWEYKTLAYIGNYSFQDAGEWTRDPTLDTDAGPVDCYYSWGFEGRQVLNAPACDLRAVNMTWYADVVGVSPHISNQNGHVESVVGAFGSTPADDGPMVPQFSLLASVV